MHTRNTYLFWPRWCYKEISTHSSCFYQHPSCEWTQKPGVLLSQRLFRGRNLILGSFAPHLWLSYVLLWLYKGAVRRPKTTCSATLCHKWCTKSFCLTELQWHKGWHTQVGRRITGAGREPPKDTAGWLKPQKNSTGTERTIDSSLCDLYMPQTFILILVPTALFALIAKWEKDSGRDRMANESDVYHWFQPSGLNFSIFF